MKFITGTRITSFWSHGAETDDHMEGPIHINLEYVISIHKYHGKPSGLEDGYWIELLNGKPERMVSREMTAYLESL